MEIFTIMCDITPFLQFFYVCLVSLYMRVSDYFRLPVILRCIAWTEINNGEET